MRKGFIFVIDGAQAVRLPEETRFPDNIKQVNVRVVGNDRVVSPVNNTWDSFFNSIDAATDELMDQRASQTQNERELF